jgi:hypothetical protein
VAKLFIKDRLADRVAIAASSICLAHCLLLPVLLALSPSLSRIFNLPEEFHLAMVMLAIPVSAIAIGRGYRHHGILAPAFVAAAGLIGLVVGAAAQLDIVMETGITVLGSCLLAGAHIGNLRLRRSTQSNNIPHCSSCAIAPVGQSVE